MLLYRLICLPLLVTGLLCLSACNQENTTTPAQTTVATADTYFPLPLDDTTLHLQLALSQSEQTRGLMFRDSLEKDHGMLFIYNAPGPLSFWMRNTRIKLDLAYLDASGKLVEIHKLYPYSETPVPSRSQAVQFAIEMNRGWFERNNLGVGAQLDLESMIDAIKARGQNPANFGL